MPSCRQAKLADVNVAEKEQLTKKTDKRLLRKTAVDPTTPQQIKALSLSLVLTERGQAPRGQLSRAEVKQHNNKRRALSCHLSRWVCCC